LKFKDFKLGVAQLAQRGQVKGHALGVGVRWADWRRGHALCVAAPAK
jgi:hypothetical protein